MIKSILVPIDGSKHSKQALGFACELANKFDASLHLLHIVHDAPGGHSMALGAAAVYYQPDRDIIEKAARSVLDAALEFASEKGFDSASTQFETRSVVSEILRLANSDKYDTIIMGSRGLSDLAGLFMGSVSHQISHHAHCNCIFVRN